MLFESIHYLYPWAEPTCGQGFIRIPFNEKTYYFYMVKT